MNACKTMCNNGPEKRFLYSACTRIGEGARCSYKPLGPNSRLTLNLVGSYLAYTFFICSYQLYDLNTSWISSDSFRYKGKPGDRGIWLNNSFIPASSSGLMVVTPMGNIFAIWTAAYAPACTKAKLSGQPKRRERQRTIGRTKRRFTILITNIDHILRNRSERQGRQENLILESRREIRPMEIRFPV